MNEEIELKKGINTLQLKYLGILFMTLDHIGAYVLNPTIVSHPLRILGRIAAPLFLYVTVNSVRHTRNKLRFAFRLYIAHVSICLITLFLTSVGKDWFGMHDQFSILSTFAYTVLLIWLIENIVNCAKEKNKRKLFMYLILIIGIILLPIVLLLFLNQVEMIWLIFVPNILMVPYSPIFVLIGICWYFLKDKKRQISALVVFSCFALVGAYIINRTGVWLFMSFFNSNQFWMILFLPFIYLYNGQKGKSMKYFFYVYYPLHVFFLMFIGQQFQ